MTKKFNEFNFDAARGNSEELGKYASGRVKALMSTWESDNAQFVEIEDRVVLGRKALPLGSRSLRKVPPKPKLAEKVAFILGHPCTGKDAHSKMLVAEVSRTTAGYISTPMSSRGSQRPPMRCLRR